MAANTFASGTTSGAEVKFDRPINHLNIHVETGVNFSFSLDSGQNYMGLPVGFHSFKVGNVSKVIVAADGAWQLIGVQA